MIDSSRGERNRMRRLLLARRDRMSSTERDDSSARIIATLVALPLLHDKQHIFTYCHFRSEVRTSALLAYCLARGARVSVPRTVPDQERMQAVVIVDPVRELAPGYMGIPEPLSSLLPDRIQSPTEIEVAVIPGAVFDRSGHRLGYGLGCYDRFLAQAPQAVRIGLAFSGQIVDRIPAQPHDEPMDIIITEQEVLTLPGRRDATDRGV